VADERPRAALIEILSVDRYSSGLVATFGSGPHLWALECRGAQLTSFARFQAAAADQLDVFIDHASQQWPTAFARRTYWQHAVRCAFAAGKRVS
jgi:hypothetical protein